MANSDKSSAPAQKGKKQAKFGEGMGSFTLAVLAILAFRWALFEPYVIPSGSMIPTLLIHDHILVNKFAFGLRIPFSKSWLFRTDGPKRGDIVVFRSVDDDGYFLIKRVVGLPGDTVDVDEAGYVTLNGTKLPVEAMTITDDPKSQEPYYPVTPEDIGGQYARFDFFKEDLTGVMHRGMLIKGISRSVAGPYKVPDNEYFCMGDNRDNSKDSRYWHGMPRENLLGKAMFVWLSCEDTLPFVSFLCNPLTIRWGRFLHVLH